MKLRTKITLLCCGVILLAILVSNIIMWGILRNTVLDKAVQSAYVEANEVYVSFGRFEEKLDYDLDRTAVQYFFKTSREDRTICVKGDEVWHNNTVLDPSLFESTEIRLTSVDVQTSYFTYSHDGRRLVVHRFSAYAEIVLYHITDISHVYRELYVTSAVMAGGSGVVLILAIVVIALILKRAFVPLRELSASVKNISAGAYDRRVSVKKLDEIGMLGRDFNSMAEAVERHTKELVDSEERKTVFMGNLTHELKTPLTAISGYAQTLRSVQLSEEDREEALSYIYREALRLDRLSKKMMGLLELDREIELEMRKIEIESIFSAAKRTCDAVAAERNVRILVGGCDGIVWGDFDLLCDAVINLIDNAVKASPENSSVELYTENGAMIVQDHGCGIPEEEIGRVLEPFYMVDKSRSRKSGGSGLGLFLVSLILGHHGMELRIESKVGEGTRMIIYNSIKSR